MEDIAKINSKTVHTVHLTPDELEREISHDGEVLEKLQKKLKKNWKDIKEFLSLLG